MNPLAAYLIGQPGAGKSTLLRAVTAGVPFATEHRPFAHLVYVVEGRVLGVQLGGAHASFAGTDRLSMSVQPLAIRFLGHWRQAFPDSVIVAEGDRLATAGFLDALDGQLVWLDTPPEIAAGRRAGRSRKAQNPAWVRSRQTKVARLLEARPHTRLDGSLPPDELAAQALASVPAFAALGAVSAGRA